MSRLGKRPVALKESVKVEIQKSQVTLQGPKGSLSLQIPAGIRVEQKDKQLLLQRESDSKVLRALHGTCRSLLGNMVQGVTEGFKRELEIEGVGFRAQVQGKVLTMQLGFSHPVVFQIPDDVKIQTPAQNKIVVEGIDKEKVGALASKIRAYYPPEPYKGKGIHYVGEVIRRKAGKTVT